MTEAKQADPNQAELKKSKKNRNSSPRDIQILTEQDQETLKQLQNALSSTGSRNLRGKQLKTFSDMISIIQKFCIRGDGYDWRRCFVCGICWLNNGIAINNRRFGCLLGKCKSSINGSFQQLGYSTAPSRSESYDSIVEAIPILKNDMPALREWTLRIKNNNLNQVQASPAIVPGVDENGQVLNPNVVDQQNQQPIQFPPIQETADASQPPPQPQSQDQPILIAPQPFSVQSMPQTTNTTAELQAVASFTPENQNFQQQQNQQGQTATPALTTIAPFAQLDQKQPDQENTENFPEAIQNEPQEIQQASGQENTENA